MSQLYPIIGMSIFNVVIMFICLVALGTIDNIQKKINARLNEEQTSSLPLQQDDNTSLESKVASINTQLIHQACAKARDTARLRIIPQDSLEYLVMIGLKHIELSESRAAELLGLYYEELRDKHLKWSKDGYKITSKED